VPLFTSGGLGLGLKNLVLFTSLTYAYLQVWMFAEVGARLQDVGCVRGVVIGDSRVVMDFDELQPSDHRLLAGRQRRRHVEVPEYLIADVLQASATTDTE